MYRKYFLRNGLQYYVAGRTTLFAGFVHIAGNLFHHGIEMLLKYLMMESERLNSDQLRKRFGHNLDRLWAEWKSQQTISIPDEFDALVTIINEWEEIRYPRPGVSMVSYAYEKSLNIRSRRSKAPKEYMINLEAMDELVFFCLMVGLVPAG